MESLERGPLRLYLPVRLQHFFRLAPFLDKVCTAAHAQ
jgi:hypothetical protein